MASSTVVQFPTNPNSIFPVAPAKHGRGPLPNGVLSFDSRPKLRPGDMAWTFDGSVVDQELVQLVRPSTAHPTAWEVIAVNAPLVCDNGNEAWYAIVAEKCLRRASSLLRPVGFPYI